MLADITLKQLAYGYTSDIRAALSDHVTEGAEDLTVQNVNITPAAFRGERFSIEIPAPYEAYNYFTCQRSDNKQYGFWILETRSVSKNAENVALECIADAVGMYLEQSETVCGVFDAVPVHQVPFLPVVIANDTLTKSRSIELPRIGREGLQSDNVLWLEITTNRSIQYNAEDSAFHKYGAIVTCKNGYVSPDSITMQGRNDTEVYSPRLDLIINNLDEWLHSSNPNFSADNIVDVSISERCPYRLNFHLVNNVKKCFIDSSSNPGVPYTTLEAINWTVGTTTYNTGLYLLDYPYITAGHFKGHSVTVDISKLERAAGQIILKDTSDNMLGTVPVNTGSLTFSVKTESDYTGLTTYVRNDDIGLVFKFPEGKLPYIGDSWTTYKAQNQQYDRECMQLSIEKADTDLLLGISQSVASGAIAAGTTGNIAGAAAGGIGIVGNIAGNIANRDYVRRSQALKESQYRISPGNNYNTGYGLDYLRRSDIQGARFEVLLPHNVGTQATLDNYVKTHGYPAAGYQELVLEKGFYRGSVEQVFDTAGLPLNLINLFENEMLKGIRIIEGANDL